MGNEQCGFKSDINCEKLKSPACPPASLLTAIKPSAPNFSTFLAYLISVTSQKTKILFSCAFLIVSSGEPKDVMIKAIFSSQQICSCSSNLKLDLLTIKLIPKAL